MLTPIPAPGRTLPFPPFPPQTPQTKTFPASSKPADGTAGLSGSERREERGRREGGKRQAGSSGYACCLSHRFPSLLAPEDEPRAGLGHRRARGAQPGRGGCAAAGASRREQLPSFAQLQVGPSAGTPFSPPWMCLPEFPKLCRMSPAHHGALRAAVPIPGQNGHWHRAE